MLILKKTKDEKELSVISEAHAEELSSEIITRKLNEMIGALLRVQSDYKTASNIKTMFEVTILKLATLEDNEVEKVEPKKVEIKKPEPIKEEVKPEPIPVPVVEPVKVKPAPTPVVEKKIEVAPSWLVDDDVVNLVDEGEAYQFEDDMLVNFMVLGDKDLRKDLLSRWSEFDSYLTNPSIGEVVAFIKDATPFIVCKDVIVLQFNFEKQVKKANIKDNELQIAEIFKKMLNKDVFVYSVSRAETVRLITAYHNLRQISQLPKPSEIKIDIKELRK